MHHYSTDRHTMDKRILSAARDTGCDLQDVHILHATCGGAFEMKHGLLASYEAISVEMLTLWT